ncbi:MAG: type VI immunity family protein [Pseudomonadota bacterium]
MTSWVNDPLFKEKFGSDNGATSIDRFATPAFRLSVNTSRYIGAPYDHVDAYQTLFDVFKPILQRDAQRLIMIGETGRPRRRRSITKDDWEPFQQQRDIHPEDDRYFLGFDYQSGFVQSDWPKASEVPTGYIRKDLGPTKFLSRDDSSGRLEASIPVADFVDGNLDVAALKSAMLGLPVFGALAGYGMCHSDTFDWPHGDDLYLKNIARKYPALDVCGSEMRRFRFDYDDDTSKHWIPGINWLTLVRDPYLTALGGIKAITDGLDSAIEVETGNNGVLFQLGDRPITGEKGVDDDLLPLYFELGQRLQPKGDGAPSAAEPWQEPFGHYSADDENKRQNLNWARRFYDRKWFEEEGL